MPLYGPEGGWVAVPAHLDDTTVPRVRRAHVARGRAASGELHVRVLLPGVREGETGRSEELTVPGLPDIQLPTLRGPGGCGVADMQEVHDVRQGAGDR